MRVLIWTQYFWPENFHINAVARYLHQNEHDLEVTILTGKPNYPKGRIFSGYETGGVYREEFHGCQIVRIPIRARGTGSASALMLNYLSFILSGYLYAPFALLGKKYDIIFVYAPSPLLQALPAISLAWLKRVPLVLWVQDLWPDALQATGFIKNRWLLGMVGLAVNFVYRFSDLILIPSEGFREPVERRGAASEKIRYHPNSADDIHAQVETHQDMELANAIRKDFSVVFAGNIGKAQSCETIVAAAKLLQDVPRIKFYLAGKGSMAESVSRDITAGGLGNVTMAGEIAPKDIPAIYAASSALLLTLRDEPALSATIPSKLQGYLAAGKPIIASSSGESANEVIRANAGLTCSPENAEELAKAVLQLYRMSPDARTNLGENGRRYFFSHYYLPDRTAELAAHFRNTVGQRSLEKRA
jgi:glycosyltransferase involved in cell wall biosynthesis